MVVVHEADATATLALLFVNSGDPRLVRERRRGARQNSSRDERRLDPFEAIHLFAFSEDTGAQFPAGYFADSEKPSIAL